MEEKGCAFFLRANSAERAFSQISGRLAADRTEKHLMQLSTNTADGLRELSHCVRECQWSETSSASLHLRRGREAVNNYGKEKSFPPRTCNKCWRWKSVLRVCSHMWSPASRLRPPQRKIQRRNSHLLLGCDLIREKLTKLNHQSNDWC